MAESPGLEEIRNELESVLASTVFRSRQRPSEVLKHVVEKVLSGQKIIREIDIAVDVFHRTRKDFDPQTDSIVRNTARDIRQLLGEYYAGEGRDNPWRIELDKYVPIFLKQNPPIPPAPVPAAEPVAEPPLPAAPASSGERQEVHRDDPPVRAPFWKNQAFLAGAVFMMGAGITGFYWFGHEGHCGGRREITSPIAGTKVHSKRIVRGTKVSYGWFCRCKDYLVVEAVGVGWFNQGRLSKGSDWSLSAAFGDAKTMPGTAFNIFVLSTTETLKSGFISSSTSGKQSPAVEVELADGQ